MLMCIDPDAIDTHKGRWLEIDDWLAGIELMPEDESRGRMTVPDALVAREPSCEGSCATDGREPDAFRPLAA